MRDMGNTDDHTNRVVWNLTHGSPSSYSWALFYRLNTAVPSGFERHFFGRIADTTSPHWYNSFVGLAGSNNDTLQIQHRDATTTTEANVATNALDDTTTTHSLVVTWDGSTAKAYFDAGAPSSVGLTRGIGTTDQGIALGFNGGGLGTGGPAARYGQVVIWYSKVLTAADVSQFHSGVSLPEAGSVIFYAPLVNDLIDAISGTAAGTAGSSSFVADAVDAYFQEQRLEGWMQAATLKLLAKGRLPEIFKIKVPWRFLAWELIEPGNVSMLWLPATMSMLDNIPDHGLVDKWRRQHVTCVGRRPLPLEHLVELTFKRREHQMLTYFATDQLSSDYSTENPGLARTDIGGTLTLDRSSKALLQQKNNEILNFNLIPLANANGHAYLPVGPYKEKLSHLGFLSEEGNTNDILNSCFIDALTSWTSVAGGGGTITATQGIFCACPQSISDNTIEITPGTVDNYIHPTTNINVLASQGNRRLSFVHSNGFGQRFHWQIQRSTDSFYWNDATPGWQSTGLWNDSEFLGHDPTNTVHIANRSTSKPISISSDQNWAIRLGIKANGSFNRELYQVDLTRGKYLYSPIVTGAAAVTTVKDTVTRSLQVPGPDPVRQLVPAARGTFSFTMLAVQDATWMADGEAFALYAWQYDTSEDNYDVIKYRKPAAAPAEFCIEHYLESGGNPVLNARASKAINIVPGTEYKIEVLWTSASDGELGLPARTYRIRVDKVNGTDAQASALHSTSEKFTKIWFGCAPAQDNSLRAMNYLHHPRVSTRCLPDEEKL